MKYRVAIGTSDKENITEHFGQCNSFYIIDIEQENGEVTFVEERETEFSSQCGEHQHEKIGAKILALKDCNIVLVKQIGGQSEKLLSHNGITPLQSEGTIKSALEKVKKFYKKQIF